MLVVEVKWAKTHIDLYLCVCVICISLHCEYIYNIFKNTRHPQKTYLL